MKIVIDGRLHGLEYAGLGRYVMSLVEELQKIDKENHYFLLLRKKQFSEVLIGENWERVLVDDRHYSVKEQISVVRKINRINPDLVHFPHFNVPLLYKGPFVVTIHDILMHRLRGKDSTTLPFYKYAAKRVGYKAVFRKSVMKSQKIMVPSESTKNDLLEYYKGLDSNKIIVTHEGLSDNIGDTLKEQEVLTKYNIRNDYFVYVGNAFPHKNLKRLVEAIYFLNQRRPKKVKLVLGVGRNVFHERLKAQIKELNAEEYVATTGFVPDAELGSLFRFSKGFVYPSLLEGFGLQGLEAMRAGTLALVSDIPVFKEIYEKHAVYFNPHDFSSIQKSMEQVLDMSVNKRKNIIKQSQKFLKKYSWKEMAQQTLEIYKSSV